ncbi:hypothetical protein [Vibrio sp. B1Z05]|uniref:hypothetical protein n=1 Tax=Vibrio sp. B1Z05 TaxID=2654980 RepID=UPI00128C7658|nr:hypothetical protein [Vibrio sp. B1Z05]MPW36118.1 hypothetical protein [Vibrio sp. B1Z05]
MELTLEELYENNIKRFNSTLIEHEQYSLNGPLLMSLDSYYKQKTKLMIVGQETHGWLQSSNIEEQVDAYKNFNVGENYSQTPFWNITRKIERVLGIDRCSVAWSNLNRFDQNSGTPTENDVIASILEFDGLVKNEIEIIKPDVLVFFTNHKNDDRLVNLYKDAKFEEILGLPDKHFKRVIHPELPKITIRAPHPKTIRIQKWEDAFIDHITNVSKDLDM